MFSVTGAGPQLSTLPQPVAATILQVDASMSPSVAQSGTVATLYVVVRNDAGEPVADAVPYVTVHSSVGDRIFKLPATDAVGMSRSRLPAGLNPGKTVPIDIEVRHEDGVGSTRTSYIVWW